MGDLEVLIFEQRELIADLEELRNSFITKESSGKSRGYLETLSQELDIQFQQFKYQHGEISRILRETSLNAADVPYMLEGCFCQYREHYFSFKGAIMDAMAHNETTRSPFSSTFAMSSGHADTSAHMDVRLPKISVPNFSGEYMDWIPFQDIYLSLVHNNPALSRAVKFYYLKGAVSGEAASLIGCISATEANYETAWNTLQRRYHNKRVIVDSHLNKFYDIPKSDGSCRGIRTILDTTRECLSSLGNMGISTANWDPMIIREICQKLDVQARKEWENSLGSTTDLPTLSEMFSFLERTFRTLESLGNTLPSTVKSSRPLNGKSFKNKNVSAHTRSVAQSRNISCLFCDREHFISKCYKFMALPMEAKNDFLANKKICRNCLSSGHDHQNCTSLYRCGTCRKPHHTILHTDETVSVQNTTIDSLASDFDTSLNISEVASHNANIFTDVLLYSIRLFVSTSRGMFPLRALLDPGSQGSLISESSVQLLGLHRQRSHFKVVGVGESISKYNVQIDLWSRKRQPILKCSALVLPSISSYVPNPSSEKVCLPDIGDNLADPLYYKTDSIDLILGSDVCSKLKKAGESFVHNDLFFQNTLFGWVFSGSSTPVRTNTVHVHNINLECILKSFWEQEEIGVKRDLTDQEIVCEKYFSETTRRTPSGRYMVHLPFKSILLNGSFPKLDNNIKSALSRFKRLEISFLKNPLYSETYRAFMADYESLGHMSRIGTFPADISTSSYFLPHHGVFKEESTTTKLRVVFDGSSHKEGESSLNEELFPGPALQNDLPQTITRWRRHKIAFGADIEKMFRQIEVSPEHRPFQQILWRSSPSEKLSIYQLNTVTYGTTSAPYLSIRVLRQLAQDYRSEFPGASEVLVSDSYVDDVLSGADTVGEAIKLHKDLCTLLKRGGCNLRKWITNSPTLLRQIPKEDRENSPILNFERDNVVKTLGVQWNTTNDSFSFKVNVDETRIVSKRAILSETARLYDPLGWLTPCTVVAKSLFKQLWEIGADWDDEIPQDLRRKWLKYRASLSSLSELVIPRWINYSRGHQFELHCFCDASSTAYAATVYSRVVSPHGVFVNLLQAKSRVTPIKTVSIPRLELCAAVLLVRLVNKVKESFSDVTNENIFFWSDSSTVLSWIRKPSSYWTVYVANRVAEIQRFSSPLQWRHVPSAMNPADCASRGIFPSELIGQKIWWFGPSFLYETPSSWPGPLSNLETFEEMRKESARNAMKKTTISSNGLSAIAVGTLNEVSPYPDFLLKFSNLYTLLKVISFCLRYRHNTRYNRENRELRETGPVSTKTLNMTLNILLKITQDIDFSEDIKTLLSKGSVHNKGLLKLIPFLDTDGILRVGGRLQNSDLPYNIKHPILLAKNNPLSRLIILDAHERTLHGGLSLTMAYVNRKYWIISGNQLAKNIIGGCMRCFRYYAKAAHQLMGNLPPVRLNITRPFKHSGVDYAGPIPVKNSSLRSSVVSKGYICLFICMVTKAIHLEAVSDLTTNSFLAAFRRFVSRRGACTDVYSDCGTNFVGASKELKVLLHRNQKSLPHEMRQNLLSNGTDWHFIPPASPNFGGLWEAGVKSVKFHLKRIMKDRVLTFEELSTLLCQIEGCLNSRPLCPLSSDPSDLDALTPAHFLIGEPTNCIQEETLLDVNINHIPRWKAVEKLKQHFWKRWHTEYLNRLQARPKWVQSQPDAKIGALVLLIDERCDPGQWSLGRILEIHPGSDDRVRVVSILIKNKIIKRPISKICFLPIDSPPEDSTPQNHTTDAGERMESDPVAVSRSTAESND